MPQRRKFKSDDSVPELLVNDGSGKLAAPKRPTAIANAAQKFEPRHGMADLFYDNGENNSNPILKIIQALGMVAEGGQNILDPQFSPVDVNLPNDSGGIIDPRIIDEAGGMPDTSSLTRPRKLPRKPMRAPLPSVHLQEIP